MKTLLFLPTQGPHMPRTGPAEQFDWRAQCRLAAALQKGLPEAVVYVPSAFQQAGALSEFEFYGGQLRAEGVPETGLSLERQGFDTIEQCELAVARAEQEQARLVVVACYVHVRRLRYLLKGRPMELFIVDGTPSPWLHFTHIVLGMLFPILDLLGLRETWRDWVAHRRAGGVQ